MGVFKIGSIMFTTELRQAVSNSCTFFQYGIVAIHIPPFMNFSFFFFFPPLPVSLGLGFSPLALCIVLVWKHHVYLSMCVYAFPIYIECNQM